MNTLYTFIFVIQDFGPRRQWGLGSLGAIHAIPAAVTAVPLATGEGPST